MNSKRDYLTPSCPLRVHPSRNLMKSRHKPVSSKIGLLPSLAPTKVKPISSFLSRARFMKKSASHFWLAVRSRSFAHFSRATRISNADQQRRSATAIDPRISRLGKGVTWRGSGEHPRFWTALGRELDASPPKWALRRRQAPGLEPGLAVGTEHATTPQFVLPSPSDLKDWDLCSGTRTGWTVPC
jgi:hypothetical protein